MDFDAWLLDNGFNPEAVTPQQKPALQAQWRAATTPNPTASVGQTVAAATADHPRTPVASEDFEARMAAINAEAERVQYIRERTEAMARANVGNPEKIKTFRAMCDSAVADPKCDARTFDLHVMRADRTAGPFVYSTSSAPQITSDVVEAAICLTHKVPGAEKGYGDQTLSAAHKHFRRGVTLKKLLMMGAQANGFRGDESDWSGVMKAAAGRPADEHNYYASVGPSTGVSVPGILSNVANKSLAASFMNVEQAWRGIAKVRPVNDFKQVTTYRMSGNNTFLRVAPSGEIRHGAMSETSYTNQAKTFGRLLGISREDYVNDDLGAFMSVTQELGRGAADGLNNIFWATWLNDSTFFKTDKSNLNYDDGATDSVLSLAGLDNAESIFAVQTKPDGTPLGATPKILLVPSALKNTALTLMQSQIANMATSTVAITGNANIFAGRYEVIASAYLSRTSLNDENGVSQTVGGSSTAWYLLCDPMDIPCIEVVFLYGKDTPTVETQDFEFDRLGLATRAYFDFGVSLQEYRGGIKLKGAA